MKIKKKYNKDIVNLVEERLKKGKKEYGGEINVQVPVNNDPKNDQGYIEWNLKPGSLINGVPASETRAIFFPFLNSKIIFGVFLSSLISLKDSKDCLVITE